jgi:hypothetical protein
MYFFKFVDSTDRTRSSELRRLDLGLRGLFRRPLRSDPQRVLSPESAGECYLW